MGDANPIRTLGDYSKPSHEGYRNTIELPVGNNVVPLRSDTIRLVQNGCSFHGLRSEDPNQHLKDFLKLVDSLDLDGENRERTRLRDYDVLAWMGMVHGYQGFGLGEMDVPMENPDGNPDEDVDMLMDDDEEDDDDEDDGDEDGWEVDDEWLMASVTPPPMPAVPLPSTFEVGGPSTAAPVPPFPMGRPLPEVVSSVAVHHEEIGGLCI
ncbi:hypothetical protein Tco_1360276 [Tanacetum coccineum]